MISSGRLRTAKAEATPSCCAFGLFCLMRAAPMLVLDVVAWARSIAPTVST